MNNINLQTMICKNNIFFYEEYIDIFIDKNIGKYIIDKKYIYDTTYKLYNFFNNLFQNRKVKINELLETNNKNHKIRIFYKNTSKKNILKKDVRKNGKNLDLIKYAINNYILNDNFELIDFILDNDYDINTFGGENNNILLEILSQGKNIDKYFNSIKKIIDKINNLELINYDNKNFFIYCIIYNYYDIIKYILETKNVNHLLQDNYCNIFYTLILFKRINLFKLCLSEVDINIENYLGENLLMIAIKFKNIDFIKLIIDDIDINHSNIFGENALLYCFFNKYYNLLNFIVERRDKDINYDIISFLIEYNYRNKYNDILFLLEKGANVNKINHLNGNIPLHDAIIYNENCIIELLIQYNSNIDHQNNDGYTPLMLAIIMNNLNIVKLLLSKNCNIYLKNTKKLNCLMISYIFDNNDIFKLLIDKYNTFDNSIINLERKIQNKNIELLLLWFDKMIKIVSSDLIKYYFFNYKKKYYFKINDVIFNNDINLYIISFLENKNIKLKKYISSNITCIKYEINNLFFY